MGLVKRCCLVRDVGPMDVIFSSANEQIRTLQTSSSAFVTTHELLYLILRLAEDVPEGGGLPEGWRRRPARPSTVRSRWSRHTAHRAGRRCCTSFPRKQIRPRAEQAPRWSKPGCALGRASDVPLGAERRGKQSDSTLALSDAPSRPRTAGYPWAAFWFSGLLELLSPCARRALLFIGHVAAPRGVPLPLGMWSTGQSFAVHETKMHTPANQTSAGAGTPGGSGPVQQTPRPSCHCQWAALRVGLPRAR